MRICWSLILTATLAASGCGLFHGPPPGEGFSLARDQTRLFHKPVVSIRSLQRQNVVMQEEDYSCGAAALATVIRYYWGDDVTEAEFLDAILENLSAEEIVDRLENGLSMTDLRRTAVSKGYLASMGRRTLAQLVEARIPLIVRIVEGDYEHFVVFRGILDDRVFLADPIRGNLRMSVQEFARRWTDGVILVVVKPGVEPPDYSPLSVYQTGPVQHELNAPRRGGLFDRPYMQQSLFRFR